MSDRMDSMSFDQLMNWVTEELENHGTLLGFIVLIKRLKKR